MPKFSIITTTYRHEKYIVETIESIVSQSFSNWELLIGDDSPDDATWNIVQKYVKKYPEKIRAWRHTLNKGVVENTNFLLSQVSPDFEYIAFLEGDDVYTPDCLTKKLEVFEKYPEVALVYSDMDFINAQSEVTLHSLLASEGVRIYQDESIPLDAYIRSKNPLIVSYSTIAIRREAIGKYIPIRNLTGSKTYAISDYDLIFHIIGEHKVYGIEQSLTLYRRHVNNLSASYGGLFDDLLFLLSDYKENQKISIATYSDKVSWIHILKSITLLASGDKSASWQELSSSFRERITSDIFYKVAIFLLILLPVSFSKKILQKRIRRGV